MPPAPAPDPRADLTGCLLRALDLLQAPSLTPASVHEIRRELKRARAALRLLRPAVGEAAYAHENRTLRDAARRLAAVRDARVTLEALERLIRRAPAGASRARLLRMRARLRQRHARLLREAGAPARRAALARTLDESRERTAHWRLPQPWHSVLVQGVERIYRRGRKALRIAAARATDRNLHEWRKQVKHLGAALDMVAPLSPRRAAKAAKKVGALGTKLGDDRDLALLCRTAELDAPLLGRVRGRRGRLQARALKRGNRLYARKPRAFVARLLG